MTVATAIRDAIYQRLTLPGHPYRVVRRTPVPQLQPDKLPALSIFVLQGRGNPDGEGNAGEPRLVWEDTIAISVARGFEDPLTLEGQIDAEIDGILERLLTDPTFVRFRSDWPRKPGEAWTVGQKLYADGSANRATIVANGNRLLGFAAVDIAADPTVRSAFPVDPLFEAVSGVNRRWVFPQDGETYFAELRLEISFSYRADFPPVVPDTLQTMHVTTAFPIGGDPASTQQVIAEYDLPQT